MRVTSLLMMLLIISLLMIIVNAMKDHCANIKTPLVEIRKKRYLTFPPGSSLVINTSAVKTIMVHVPTGWYSVIEVDVIFPLLSPEMTNTLFRKKLHHRQKREFWEAIENAFTSYNLNGRSCIFRSICEAKQHLGPPGKSLVHDVLRAIFSAPLHDAEFKDEISRFYVDLIDPDICNMVHDCPISLLEILLELNKSI